MFIKKTRIPLLVLLAVLLVMQVVFAGRSGHGNTKAADGNVSLADGSDDSEQSFENSEVSVKLNVVYKNTLTSSELSDVQAEALVEAYYTKIVAFTSEKIYMYESPSESSKVTGVLYSGSEGNILEIGEEWSLIESGGLTGYVRNVGVLFGEEAEKLAKMIGHISTTVKADDVTLYVLPDAASEQIATVAKSSSVDILGVYEDYLLVLADGDKGYVAKDSVDVSYGLDYAITVEEENKRKAEEAARLAAEKAAAAEKNNQNSQKQLFNIPITQRTPYNATPEELHLLACIIYRESNNQPYEGKLAVANVVLNRVFNPRFKQNNITDVIYAPNQFAGTGVNGVPSEAFLKYYNMTDEQLNRTRCYDAAVEACAGVNNIGDLCYFMSPRSKLYDTLIAKSTAYYIIAGHTFYTVY